MQNDENGKQPSKLIVILLAAAFVAAVAGLVWSYSLAGRLTHAEAQLAATQKQNQQLATALNSTNAKLNMTSESLGHRLGTTQRELQRRADELLHGQQAGANQGTQENTQLSSAEKSATGGTTDAGGMIAGATQTNAQPATGEAQTQGDTGGLIATNEHELQVLERLGRRNYYPFTLRKGKKEYVATVALELRGVNVKHSTYTMTVFSGNKKMEQKNRALDEPVQFYTGKQQLQLELVVNQIGHDQVQGYIATPSADRTSDRAHSAPDGLH